MVVSKQIQNKSSNFADNVTSKDKGNGSAVLPIIRKIQTEMQLREKKEEEKDKIIK